MRVVVFGTFDPLHAGHRAMLAQAAALGEEILVVAARDSYIRAMKGREPRVAAEQRRQALLREPTVTEVRWADEWPNPDPFRLLRELSFEVVALGYDQTPSDEVVRAELAAYGKESVQVVRLKHQPLDTDNIA